MGLIEIIALLILRMGTR